MFDVFISYSHDDVVLVEALASGLARIGKPWWRRRSLHVFRDTNVMSASPDLWDSIRSTLDDSQWFVAVLSPTAAASPWVTRELDWWVTHRGDDHLLLVLADGTCAWDPDTGDWAADATAIGPTLRGVFNGEPRWVDATWTRDQPRLHRRDGRFLDLLAEIAAPVQGTTKDAIVGEELRQHRRTLRTAIAAATGLAVLAVAAVIAAVIALDQRNQAEHRRQQALSQSLAGQSAELATHRPDLGILLALQAWRHAHTTQAEQALLDAAGLEGQLPRVVARGAPVLSTAYDAGVGAFVVLHADGSLATWSPGSDAPAATGLRIPQLMSLLPLGTRVAGVTTDGTVYDFDAALRHATDHWSTSTGPRWTAMSPDVAGTRLVVGDELGRLQLWSVADHTPIGPPVTADAGPVLAVGMSPDGSAAVSSVNREHVATLWAVTPSGLQATGNALLQASASSAVFTSDGRTVAVGEENGVVEYFDAATAARRADVGSQGAQAFGTAPINGIIPLANGGLLTVGADGWVRHIGSDPFPYLNARRPPASTPIVAAVDPTGTVTLVGSYDGTLSVDDATTRATFGKRIVASPQFLVIGQSTAADRVPILQFLPSDGAHPPGAVTVRTVEASGRWSSTVAKTGPVPDAAGAIAIGGSDSVVVDWNGVLHRYHGSTDTRHTFRLAQPPNGVPTLVPLGPTRFAVVDRTAIEVIGVRKDGLRRVRVYDQQHYPAGFSVAGGFGDGRRMVVAMGDATLRVFDVTTGKQLVSKNTGGLSLAVSVSPDDSLIAYSDSLTGQVSIRDARTLDSVGSDIVVPGLVTDMAWLDGGRRLALTSTDGVLHYWDVAERKELAALNHGTVAQIVTARPSGFYAYSMGIEQVNTVLSTTVREWNLSPERAAQAACDEAGRNLTRDEWNRYLGDEPYEQSCAEPRSTSAAR